MIKDYIIERRSWIIFFLFIHCLFLLMAYIDPKISFTGTLYIVFLSLLAFIIFIIIRYQRETAFFKRMKEQENTRHANYPFERMVQKRMEQQIEQSKKEITQYKHSLEQEKDDLLSWIHEVKTPLTTMQLMMDQIDNDALKTKIIVEWMRIDHLLDQQLHQKRIPFIENDLHIEKVPLQPIIHEEIKMLQSWCIHKGIGFNLSLDKKEVLSDGKWLSFIIRQLLTNAVKYSSQSDIVIQTYQQDKHTVLEVTDDGKGIDPKDLPRIFDRAFTSTADYRNSNISATGMGLYLAQEVARALFIQINVQSILNKGTTFTLTFPQKNDFVKMTSM